MTEPTTHTEATTVVPELETVTDHNDLPNLAVITDTDALDDIIGLERELLTALLAAPQPLVAATITALVGTHADRTAANGAPATAIPLTANLFLDARHNLIFTTIVDMLDQAIPITAILLNNHLAEAGHRDRVRALMIDLAAPNGPGPLPGGIDLPHLAAALVDSWYRRGYSALLARMAHVTADEPSTTLAGHWAALTIHQQAAERRWLTIRDTLATL